MRRMRRLMAVGSCSSSGLAILIEKYILGVDTGVIGLIVNKKERQIGDNAPAFPDPASWRRGCGSSPAADLAPSCSS